MSVLAADGSAEFTAAGVGVLVVVVIVVLGVQRLLHVREQERHRAAKSGDPGRLSRSNLAVSSDPMTFGGGASSAVPGSRRETVAYGYLGVLEEYSAADTGKVWTTLGVTLPGWLPYLVIEHRSTMGRAGVPAPAGRTVPTGDRDFDTAFCVVASDPRVVERVLTPAVRASLARFPLQRVSLSGRTMLLRTFDDNPLSETVAAGLDLAAAELLSTAPAFVMAQRPQPGAVAAGLPQGDAPLPEGFYGPE